MGEPESKESLLAKQVAALLPVLRQGDEDAALRVLEEALRSGLDGPSIYLGVLQPAMDQIGCLWEEGRATIGEEHRASALTRWLMDALWDEFIPKSYRADNRLLAGCVHGERHDLGLTMVTRFLRREGWHVVDLGADVPEQEFAEMAAAVRPRACLLSAATVEHLDGVRATIAALQGLGLNLPILVGGVAFRHHPHLATVVGATGMAADAAEAVDRVRQILTSHPPKRQATK